MPKIEFGPDQLRAAMITPTSMPTTPHTTVMIANCRTTL